MSITIIITNFNICYLRKFNSLLLSSLQAHQGIFLSRFLFALAVLLYRSSFVLGVKHFFPLLSPSEVGYLVSYTGFLAFIFGMVSGWVSASDYYAGNDEKMQVRFFLQQYASTYLLKSVLW